MSSEEERLKKELSKAKDQLLEKEEVIKKLKLDADVLKEELKASREILNKLGEERLEQFELDDKEIKIGTTIAKGSFGTVFNCEWERKGKYALKEVPLTSSDPGLDVLDEFRQQVSLVHPNILRVFGYTKPTSHSMRIVMEKMHCDLMKYVYGKKLTIPEKVSLMKMMVDGLHFLHNQKSLEGEIKPLLHRDIKPENFLISEDGKDLKLCDFGMIKTLSVSQTSFNSGLRGTPNYQAPEVLMFQKYSMSSDIYALGITWWCLLFEREDPYGDKTKKGVVEGIINKGLRPSVDHPALPEEFRDLLKKMWGKNRKLRPSTAYLNNWFRERHFSFFGFMGNKAKYEGKRFPPDEKDAKEGDEEENEGES